MGDRLYDALGGIREVLESDEGYLSGLGQRGPCLHTICWTDTILLGPARSEYDVDYGIDRVALVDAREGETVTLPNDAIKGVLEEHADDPDVASLVVEGCMAVGHLNAQFDGTRLASCNDSIPDASVIDLAGLLSEAEGYDEYEDQGGAPWLPMLAVDVMRSDRGAVFLSHEEAQAYLDANRRRYGRDAHTWCERIPEGSALDGLLRSVGPIHE